MVCIIVDAFFKKYFACLWYFCCMCKKHDLFVFKIQVELKDDTYHEKKEQV